MRIVFGLQEGSGLSNGSPLCNRHIETSNHVAMFNYIYIYITKLESRTTLHFQLYNVYTAIKTLIVPLPQTS